MHGRYYGIGHRDLRPRNVLVLPDRKQIFGGLLSKVGRQRQRQRLSVMDSDRP